jgi:membrane fusion protein, multidrug efflux system
VKITRRAVIASTLSVAALAALLIAATAQARANKPEARPPAPAPSAVQLVEVRPVQMVAHEDVSGSLDPARSLKVGFEVPGRLARILVKKGAAVALGSVIAQLDPELADAQVQQAAAAVKAAEAQSSIAEDTARRQSELQKKGSVSDWQSKSSTSQAAAAEAQLQAARAQLAQARAMRKRHDLRAPFAGILIDAPDQVGATVSSGKELFTLEQLDPLVLKLTVPESARNSLRIGSRVQVAAVGGPARADDATVHAIILSADPTTRRIPVEIAVPNRDGRFTAHTLARAVLPLGSPEQAQSLPASALASVGGDHVFVLGEGGEVRRVAVQVIERGAKQVVVKSVETLARVIDYPAVDLAEGTKVSVR